MKQRDFSDIFDAPIDSQLVEDVTQMETIYSAAEPPVRLSWTRFQFQLRQHTPLRQAPTNHFLPSQAKKPRFKRWQLLAAAAALLIVFIGAELIGPFAGLLGGSQPVYAQVNQSRQDQGIT